MRNKYDHKRLIGLMRENGYSQEKLSREMGISETALWNKLHCRSDFTDTEIFIIMKILGIVDPVPYFFA